MSCEMTFANGRNLHAGRAASLFVNIQKINGREILDAFQVGDLPVLEPKRISGGRIRIKYAVIVIIVVVADVGAEIIIREIGGIDLHVRRLCRHAEEQHEHQY